MNNFLLHALNHSSKRLLIEVFKDFINYGVHFSIRTAFEGHGVKVGSGPCDPGPPSKFKSGTRDPPKV